MSKFNPKLPAPVDVLVIGDHPCAYFAAMLLAQKSGLRIVLATLNGHGGDDRLLTINPALFDLHPLIAGLKSKLKTTSIYGLHFLSDQADISSEHRTKSIVVHTARYGDVRDAFAKLFEACEIEILAASSANISKIDELGLELTLGKHTIKPRALVLANESVGAESVVDEKKLLGAPTHWEPEVMHRLTMFRSKTDRHLNLSAKSLMPMSLDLRGQLCWGWLLPGDGEFQLIVDEPISKAVNGSGQELLSHWADVLKRHGVLGEGFEISKNHILQINRPMAGALAHEGVANRTLMIGPAGGFYSACGEDIYPCSWSAVFAADVMKKALKEKHLQDALNPFRHKWRTTLGDYLRGPHQNLRFLLPLVYRNPAMTQRIAEAILLSKSVVR